MSTTRTFTVVGMTCEHCVRAVREEVGGIAGVEDVGVDLSTGQLVMTASDDIPDDRIVGAVGEAGYEVAP